VLTADTTVTWSGRPDSNPPCPNEAASWSPSPVPTRASQSIPRTGGRRSEGHELGKRDSDAPQLLKGARAAVTPFPHREPSPGADPGRLLYKGRATAVCDGEAPAQAMAVASASRPHEGSCLRRCEVPSVAGESGFEPELNGPEPIVLPGYTIPHGCGRRDSDPHGPHGPPGLEPGVATVTPLPPGRPNTPCVRRERLERSPRRLRVCCSGH
jgi:hypothetical protein